MNLRHRKLTIFVLIVIIMAMFTPFASADEGQDHDHDDEEEEIKKLFLGIEGEILGTVALWTMIATLTILIWKPLRARMSISGHDWFKLEKKPFKTIR